MPEFDEPLEMLPRREPKPVRKARRHGPWLFAFHPRYFAWSLRPRLDRSPRHFSLVWLGVEIARAA